jgi:hypothetical protein
MYGSLDMFAAVRMESGIPWEVKVVGADIKRRVPRLELCGIRVGG